MRTGITSLVVVVLLTLCCVGAGTDSDTAIPVGYVRVTTAKVMDNPSCLVQQIFIDIPKGTPRAIVKGDFRWKNIIHVTGGSGYGVTDREPQRVVVTIVGQAAKPDEGNLPKIVNLFVQYRSLIESQAHPIDDKQELADVLKIDVKPGLYQLEQPILVGQYGGQPMTFCVSAKALEDAK